MVAFLKDNFVSMLSQGEMGMMASQMGTEPLMQYVIKGYNIYRERKAAGIVGHPLPPKKEKLDVEMSNEEEKVSFEE